MVSVFTLVFCFAQFGISCGLFVATVYKDFWLLHHHEIFNAFFGCCVCRGATQGHQVYWLKASKVKKDSILYFKSVATWARKLEKCLCQEPRPSLRPSLIFFQCNWSACYPVYIFLCCFGDVSKREIPFFQNLSSHPKGDCSVLWPLFWDPGTTKGPGFKPVLWTSSFIIELTIFLLTL